MNKQVLTNQELSSLCRELSLLLHAGVGVGDGLTLLAEEETAGSLREMLAEMARSVDEGKPLSAVMEESGRFPTSVAGLVTVGEQTGRLEETLAALAQYHDDRDQMDRQIRSSLLYPALLLVLMLMVIGVLLVRVLPVFDQVYASLGGALTGVAGGLLSLGRGLDKIMPVLWVLLGLAVIAMGAFSLSGGFRAKLMGWWRRHRGDKGVSRQMSEAQVAQALAMGLRSGLPLEESLDLAGRIVADIPTAVERCRTCRERLGAGEELAGALRETGVLPAAACRLLALGMRAGSGDSVMDEIARRLTRESQEALERKAARVEPALVLVTSALVGAILLAVMLPLMHIMSAIG